MHPTLVPRPGRTVPSFAARVERLELCGVERSLAACGWSARAGPSHAPAVTASVAAGECVSLVGDRRAAVALLWCVAGLTRPSGGELRWLGRDGTPRPAPPRAFVGAGWRGYDCWAVRDALESAVPPGTLQADADRRIGAVQRRYLPGVPARTPLAALRAEHRWAVGVGAAVVAGARWLLLEAPAAAHEDPVMRPLLRRLLAARRTLLAVAADAASAVLPESRLLPLAPLAPLAPVAVPQRDSGAARRVAELADPGLVGARTVSSPLAGSVDLPPGAP